MEPIDKVIKEREMKRDALTQKIKDSFLELDLMESELSYFKSLKERLNND
jgi:hypothetical protein|tara:strand:- start:121 stop:270 length:150 start_codon:yes stop_codon:yes gene_type:complete